MFGVVALFLIRIATNISKSGYVSRLYSTRDLETP